MHSPESPEHHPIAGSPMPDAPPVGTSAEQSCGAHASAAPARCTGRAVLAKCIFHNFQNIPLQAPERTALTADRAAATAPRAARTAPPTRTAARTTTPAMTAGREATTAPTVGRTTSSPTPEAAWTATPDTRWTHEEEQGLFYHETSETIVSGLFRYSGACGVDGSPWYPT